MKICRREGALLLHWEVWLATPTPPSSQYFSRRPGFCSPGHHHQYSHTLRPNLSLSQSKNFFSENLILSHIASFYMIFLIDPWIFDFPLQIPLSPILTSRWIVTNFTFQHSARSRGIFLLLELMSAGLKVKLWFFRNWHSIVRESGFSTNLYFLKYYWLFTRRWALNISNIHKVTKVPCLLCRQ